MSLEWEHVVVDALDPVTLGQWWLEALGWIIVNDDPDEFEIRPQADGLPGIIFEPVQEAKQSKNPLHLDLRPDDRDAEVERLIALGASRADIGQGAVSWVVLADPEGNEFCVLQERPTKPTDNARPYPRSSIFSSAASRPNRGATEFQASVPLLAQR